MQTGSGALAMKCKRSGCEFGYHSQAHGAMICSADPNDVYELHKVAGARRAEH